MTYDNRAPLFQGGARPSLATLERLGTCRSAYPEDLAEGDVILYDRSAFYVVKKASQHYKGSYITLRELVTNTLRTVRIETHVKVSRFALSPTISGYFGDRWESWNITVGDIVVYPGLFSQASVLVIRHLRGWFRTEAPWTPMADAEIVPDIFEKRALMVRSNVRLGAISSDTEFKIGSAVATRDLKVPEPSVWFRQAEDYWVGNSRQAPLSDQMIRYELGRRTYQVLRLPEAT